MGSHTQSSRVHSSKKDPVRESRPLHIHSAHSYNLYPTPPTAAREQ